jgi:hypothetical protein
VFSGILHPYQSQAFLLMPLPTLAQTIKGTVQPFERWFLRRISALLIEKTN